MKCKSFLFIFISYHKQAKGKDLSLRSSEDLDCIFGRKKSKMPKEETEVSQNVEETKVSRIFLFSIKCSAGIFFISLINRNYYVCFTLKIKNQKIIIDQVMSKRSKNLFGKSFIVINYYDF